MLILLLFSLGSRPHALSKGLEILKGLLFCFFFFFLVKHLPELFKVTVRLCKPLCSHAQQRRAVLCRRNGTGRDRPVMCTFNKNLELNAGFFPAVSKHCVKQVADMYAITEDNLLALSFTSII